MEINKDWRTVFKRYSFLAHIAIAVSSVGIMAITPFIGTIPLSLSLGVIGTLSVLGVIGSFIQQTNKENKNDKCGY